MTRILYGYSGEGSGHSARAREMATSLLAAGHELKLASYDRGYRNLRDEFDVVEIDGLTIASEDNRVSRLATIVENMKRLPSGTKALKRLRNVFRSFRPHVVISDFEPMTAYLAEHFEVPLISVDNQHRMRYMDYAVPPGLESSAAFTRRLVRAVVPWPSVALITSLVPGPVRRKLAFVFPPIVRREVRAAPATFGESILVYLTHGFDSLLPMLQRFPREHFHVYGYDRDGQEGNLDFHRPSKEGFLNHLAAAKAVISTAGFTLLSEAQYLGKPVFAMPMANQYEQELNAWQLQTAGLGVAAKKPDETQLASFLYRLPEFRDALSQVERDDGTAISKKLLELVADNAEIAKAFRRKRQTGEV